MKLLKPLLIILMCCFATSSNAQIWKKLAKKAEKAAEKTLEKKVEQKTERETEKAFDSTFNNSSDPKTATSNNKSPFGTSTSAETPANTYTFSHKYVMQIEDGKRTTNLAYYLTNAGNYFGTSIPDKTGKNDVISVMDIDKKSMYMFMDNKGDKTLMAMGLNFEDSTNDAINQSKISIIATGNTKTILGYTCEAFKVKGPDIEGTVWITQNAGISFVKSMYNLKSKKGNNQSWMKMIDGLTLEMDMVDTSKRKPKAIKMTCIALDKTTITIKSSDYKKLM
ncbi:MULTISPECIES: DUF4412 domain-containing protein [unclassified Olleya]|jgi:hypothetical protein|uniref:DUF4412 domain-containing protein n=1 Tax=unclassified Olleya TaxID=2615019 RepID=UPI00119F59A7|nr:DUF4412 domain-containing protein [Olleya sp. Hel_I_94]